MAKRQLILISVILLGIFACQPAVEVVPEDPTHRAADYTTEPLTPEFFLIKPSPTRRPTSTATLIPTPTPYPPTTPYPTFDIAGLVTHTPAPPAECPPSDPELELVLDITNESNPNRFDDVVWQALEEGASLQQVSLAFDRALGTTGYFPLRDLNGDGVDELIVRLFWSMLVIGCDQGDHRLYLDYSIIDGGVSGPFIISIADMNLNGTLDVVLEYAVTTGGNSVIDILEWDGNEFVSIILANHGENSISTSHHARALYWYDTWFRRNLPVMNARAEIVIRDIDGNGTKELIITDRGPSHLDTLLNFGPWRGQQVIFDWDGFHFLYVSLDLDPPDFRFQAVQDADRYFLLGDYERAMQLYQEVVFSDELDWWSAEKMDYLTSLYHAQQDNLATPTPIEMDVNEYPYLAAYARYRIVLHHLARGWASEAQTVNETLQAMFPPGGAGHEYATMAALLWDEYQASNSLEQACAAVIAYVEDNQGILAPLGDKEHGLQSHIYEPADVCPFPWPPIGQ